MKDLCANCKFAKEPGRLDAKFCDAEKGICLILGVLAYLDFTNQEEETA